MKLKISIIVTVFNESKRHLKDCLRSVLSQSLRPDEYEIILVDDCSTSDETLEVIKQLEKSESRVKIVRHEINMGLNDARRSGVRAAAGDYVVFVDGDDFISSDALESLRMQALHTNADIVLSFFYRWNSANQTYEKLTFHGTSLPRDYNKRLEAFFSGSSSFTMCGRLLRRSLLTDEVFDMPRVFHEDMISFGRLIFKAESVSAINRHIYYYRWNPESTTSKVTEQHLDGVILAITDWNRQAQQRGLGEYLAKAITEKSLLHLDSIVRRVLYTCADELSQGLKMLTDLWSRLPGKLGNWLEKTERKSLKLLHEIFQGSLSPSPEYLSGLVDRLSLAKRPAQFDTAAILPEGLKQSEMACRLAGAVVIICQVNYHVRNAAQLLPSLRNQGYRCIVMDNSTFVARGARKSSEDDRAGIQESEYVLVQQGPYGSDWLANASLVVTYNDFNDDFREALEFRRLLGNRSVSVVEGINDFLRVDFAEPRYLPYRRCDTVFLAGSHDRRYFTDRETYVTGLPIIEALINKKVQFPSEPLAILNVNFTYGALEDRRDEFVTAAAAAFKLAGWQWVITQHPMDQGVLDGMPVSRMSQYELIDTGSVFVSRFATGILEALASGKPAIYFNPHGEQVTKFKDPNGAFFVANNSEELVSALENTRREIEAGVDFRGRASDFLEKHTGYALGGPSAEQKFAKAVNLILKPLHSINQFFESGQHKLGQLSNKYAPDIFNNSLKSLVIDISYAAKSEMEGEPNISVIIPCFNGEAYLPICLESLKRQTLPHNRFEIICIDDCSTDDTPQILASYQNQMSNLRIIRHAENRKQGAARNTGLDVATGRYVTFLDSDDFLRIDALEIMLNQVGEKDLLVCQHILTRFDRPFKHRKSNRHVVTSLSLAALENTIGWWPFGMLIERKMLEGANIRFREGVFWEDIDFNIRVCLNAKSYVVSPEVIYYYIQHGSSTVNSIDEKKLVDSVSAIAHVEGTELSKVSENEQTKFRKAASWWLLYQSRRLRDSSSCLAEKKRLAGVYVAKLKAAGLLASMEPDLEANILKTVVEKPRGTWSYVGSIPKSYRYSPWKVDFRQDFADKAIFFCEVDYHIRSAVPIVRELKKYGLESIVIDASRSTSFSSNRPLRDEELPLYADIDLRPFNVAKTLPFATDAGAFIFMNDLTYTKSLIFENFGFGVPTFGFYEGINDDWNLDRVSPRMPYRSTDYLLLPGIYQQGFYADRECRIVGLPNVRTRLTEPYIPPVKRRAIINVNFTYGVLEDRRDQYVETAVQACKDIGLDYVITQHPADKADLSRFNVAKQSVYELLDEGTVLISRFSTTILEALATGRPAVYHNPIGEKVPKFHQPLGAFSVSNSVESLRAALQRELDFIDKGGDVRSRAALFLHFHCNSSAEDEPAVLAAKAISEVVLSPPPRFDFKVNPLASPVRDSHGTSKPTAEKSLPVGANQNVAVSLVEANRLLRKGEYEKAAFAFVQLHEMRPLKIYEDNALFAARKLGLSKLSSIGELRSKFVG